MENDPPADSNIDFEVFQLSDVRVGEIRTVARAQGTRSPSYRLVIDFGPEIGTRVSLARATNYPPEALAGKQVLAVVNLKPRQIGKYVSEVLTLGVPTPDRGTALIVPDMVATLGGRLF